MEKGTSQGEGDGVSPYRVTVVTAGRIREGTGPKRKKIPLISLISSWSYRRRVSYESFGLRRNRGIPLHAFSSVGGNSLSDGEKLLSRDKGREGRLTGKNQPSL